MNEVAIDLAGLTSLIKPILAVVFLIIGIVFFMVPWFKDLSSKFVPAPTPFPVPTPSPAPTPSKIRSSDAPAPLGLGEFLKIIETTAPNANPTIWWGYAKAEMTEAQVAIAEAKLARHNDIVPSSETSAEVKN